MLGRLVRSNGVYHQIVGVMPATFDIPRGVQAWLPLSNAAPGHKGRADWPYLALVGRLKPGVSPVAARSEFDAYLAAEAARTPDDLPHVTGDYRTLTDYVVGTTRPVALALTAASALVLLLACLNVANLLVVRSVARQRELAIRTALGAERWAVMRQLIAETGLLGIMAAVAGVAAAWIGLRVFVVAAPTTIPRLADMRLNGTVLLAAVGAAWAALVLCGIGPALWLSRGDLTAPLRSSSNSSTDAPGTRRLKRSLVVAQVALAQLVLIGAGLLTNSLLRLEHVNLGFRPEHVAFGRVGIGYEYANVRRFRALFAATLPMIRSIPGVVDATVQQQPPLGAAVDWWSTYELVAPTPGVSASSVRDRRRCHRHGVLCHNGGASLAGPRVYRGRPHQPCADCNCQPRPCRACMAGGESDRPAHPGSGGHGGEAGWLAHRRGGRRGRSVPRPDQCDANAVSALHAS